MNAIDFFKKDHYATMTGIEILEISKGYAKVMLSIKEMHLNAGNTTQGGAIFTLADLALAAASNSHGKLALNISSSIRFLKGSGPGDILYAEAKERFLHKRIAYYQVDVTNQKGELIATLEGTVYRKNSEIDFNI
jgi:acyl-CoA thioesterase